MDLFLFGDQTAEPSSLLQKAFLSHDNGLLKMFLNNVNVVLRDEIQELPRFQRQAIPDFSSTADLVHAYYGKTLRIPQLESCFATIAQLAHYIGYYSDNPSDTPLPSDRQIIGICTGMLAASVVASSSSLTDLLPLAVEAVRVAFRVGSLVSTMKDLLEPIGSAQGSWSTIVTDIPEEVLQKLLDDYHRSSGIPTSSQIYVSAVGLTAMTISGPPSTIQRFLELSKLSNQGRLTPISVFAPYHARHLYSDSDIDHIIGTTSRNVLKAARPVSWIFSASDGSRHIFDDTLDLIRVALREILVEPVRLDKLLDQMIPSIRSNEHSHCSVTMFGEGNIANSFASALKAAGVTSINIKDHQTWISRKNKPRQPQDDKIAIIGMSGRFPGATSHEELWELLENGLDVHREVPIERFDHKVHCDITGRGKNMSHTPYGCFIDEPGLFDPRFFSMSPREAAQTDPMARLALVTAYEALEMAGYVPNRTPSTRLDRIGTFYGQTSDDWREINAAENIDTYFITGGVRAFGPGRINYHFKFSGPSFSIDTACSSSLAAIQLACTLLWAGDCDTACAGGVNVLTNPDIFAGLSKGQFLSKTGGCKTYDNDADGYCRGDSCGTVILKRYQDAVADKDNILGVILSAATNHSAEAISITHPHAGAQEVLYKKVLASAKVDPNDISYVEMHGTGTQAGDGVEMTSVTNVLASPHRPRRPEQTLHLGAIKANIGHGEAASGISSLIKILMMFQKNIIPANVGIKGVMNKSFPSDLLQRNVHIETKNIRFPRTNSKTRQIVLNNFSAAGGNTALVIEDSPLLGLSSSVDPRSSHVITVSAKSIASLRRNIENLIDWLDKTQDVNLANLAYTTTARRIQHNYRVALSISDITRAKIDLSSQLRETYNPIPHVPKEVVFAFTGQGSQYASLGQQLYSDLSSFRVDIDQLNCLALSHGLPSFLPLIKGDALDGLSPVVLQVGMSCIQVALTRMWASWDIKPTAVIGHSLGEYAALCASGVLSMSDMVLLVGRRAQLLEEYCSPNTHGMLAVRTSVQTIKNVLGSEMPTVACINGPEDTVLSGKVEILNSARVTLATAEIAATPINVRFAFHSSQIDPILAKFESLASSISFNTPQVPLLSSLLGKTIDTPDTIGPQYLSKHARQAVNFLGTLKSAEKAGIISDRTAWLEIGPHPLCSGMIKKSVSKTSVMAATLRRDENAWKTIATSICDLYLAGVPVNFNEYHREFDKAHQLLTLPRYSFDNKRYWLDYHNNWTLTKGEKFFPILEFNTLANSGLQTRLCTTSCQRVVLEELHASSGRVIVQSNLNDPKLRATITGHLVNNTPLCPSSLYADQAMTVADYLYRKLRPKDTVPGLNVCAMEVFKPLILQSSSEAVEQHLLVEATVDLGNNQVKVNFRTVNPNGSEVLANHASGTVQYEDINSWKEKWKSVRYMVLSRIDILEQKLENKAAHQIQRGMAYKLFKALVTYADRYQGMEQVVLDSQQTEALAHVRFQTTSSDGFFFCSPYWIDSLAHVSGFTVNASEYLDSDDSVYISHGWRSIKIAEKLSPEKIYRSYVRMQSDSGNISVGDVYIFEEEQIIGAVMGLKFQKISRRALNIMLPPGKNVSSKAVGVTSMDDAPSAFLNTFKDTSLPPGPTSAQAIEQPSNDIISRVMKIIAEETDVDMSELVEEANFEDLGVDSLMSLTISARFREDLNLEIPSTLFTDYLSVREMKLFFSQFLDTPNSLEDNSSHATSEEHSAFHSPPNLGVDSAGLSSASSVSEDLNLIQGAYPTTSRKATLVRDIVASEMGVDVSEITDDLDLAQAGMDSLMSLTILGALREKTGVDISSNLFASNLTINEIEKKLRIWIEPHDRRPRVSLSNPRLSEVSKMLKTNTNLHDVSSATSVLLQGNPKTSPRNLFLLPDGSGSATSYVSIPLISPSLAVYGLNCPFIKQPEMWTSGVEGVSTLYIKEIRRRQPKGPYILGGWSAGGVLAYEVCQQLVNEGQEVEILVLIDAPCPVALDPLPARLHIFFDQIGLLGTGKPGGTPGWLLPHFAAAIQSLKDYNPVPMDTKRAPKVLAIWCTDGVCPNPEDPRPPPGQGEDPAPMRWLLNNRTIFDDNGWAQLLPRDNFEFAVMGGNHFTMMKGRHATTLRDLITAGLER